ncbi:MAG: hypothetical protein GOVbin3762_14 [Prokaryotic dsDNA virus sp.]|nr:MAG: hypothetical protein GOVbin3762_14 [Prokaryotic dsDNA virus sp.]|tara:strand:+ start:1876 stop:2517 length:642 start_codon:yes stop_codon:yes gene_type:complete
MSIELLNLSFKVKGLTPTKKLILVILCNYADEKGSCYPSYQHIADIVGLKDSRGVRRTIKEFEKLGILKIQNRILDNGSFTSNRYYIQLAKGIKNPMGADTHTLWASQPCNTKEDTKTLYSTDFINFWNIYPRKASKFESAKSFKKAIQIIQKEELILKASEYAKSVESLEDKSFIPHAVTWLNQRRYFDDIEVLKEKKKRPIANDWATDLEL